MQLEDRVHLMENLMLDEAGRISSTPDPADEQERDVLIEHLKEGFNAPLLAGPEFHHGSIRGGSPRYWLMVVVPGMGLLSNVIAYFSTLEDAGRAKIMMESLLYRLKEQAELSITPG